MVKPKKHLGQHFLTDLNIAGKIAACLSNDYSTVCELGPGTGVLTKPLLENSSIKKLKLVEIDNESVVYLNAYFSDERLSILEADFLRLDVKQISEKPFALIGNFPYNISSQIFFKVLENRDLIPEVVGMIQKEVAERIASPPGNKTYGILSVLLQAWYHIDYCFSVSEKVFYPPPRVQSAVIRLTRNDTVKLDCNEKQFFTVVKTAFNLRRKTLRNALKPILKGKKVDHPLFDKRAEQLGVEEFVELTRLCEQSLFKG
jgi:16S rRNA (adenine1518-N6/adenine1519-N6)-dimethyltransferase